MKPELVRDVIRILSNEEFQLSDCSSIRSCFDILAKKKHTLLIKILSNIEGLSRINSYQLRKLSSLISAIPLVIGERMKAAPLSNGIIYSRYDLKVMNKDTLKEVVSEHIPSTYSVRGNYCMAIDPALLKELRTKLQMSQHDLAMELKVSKQSIYRYENSGRISIDIAERLMDFLDSDLTLPLKIEPPRERIEPHPIENMTLLKRTVLEEFRKIGFFTSITNAPFDLLAEESHHKRVLTIASDSRHLERKAELIKRISRMVDSYSVCISHRKQVVDIPALKLQDLKDIQGTDELIDLLAET